MTSLIKFPIQSKDTNLKHTLNVMSQKLPGFIIYYNCGFIIYYYSGFIIYYYCGFIIYYYCDFGKNKPD